MLNRTGISAVAAIVLLLTVGCSSAEPSPPGVSKSETQVESEAIPKSERGNIVKQVGEPAELRNADGDLLASLTINSIEVDPACPSADAVPAEIGHIVALDVEFESTADFEKGTLILGPWGFRAIDDEGVTLNGDPESVASVMCLEANSGEFVNRTPNPGEKIVGKVMLDVPSSNGVLVFADMWEWEY